MSRAKKYFDFLEMNRYFLSLPVGEVWQKRFFDADNYMWRYDDLSGLIIREPHDSDIAELHSTGIILEGRTKKSLFSVNSLLFRNGKVVPSEQAFPIEKVVDIIKNHRDMARTLEEYTREIIREVFDLADRTEKL